MSSILGFITEKLLEFALPELITWIFIRKYHNKFRFRFRTEDGGDTKFYVQTWFILLVMIVLIVFSPSIFEFIVGQKISAWVMSLGNKMIFVTLLAGGFTFLWAHNYLLEKSWNMWSWVFLATTIFSFLALIL